MLYIWYLFYNNLHSTQEEGYTFIELYVHIKL